MEVFQGEDDTSEEGELQQIEVLSPERLRAVTKALSEDRNKLNQRMESLTKELDLNTAKLESLQLVGGDNSDVLEHIHSLHDLGQSLSDALLKVDQKLKLIRMQEESLQDQGSAPL